MGYESEARRKGRRVLFLIPISHFGTFVGMLEFNLLERQIASPAPMAERHATGRPVGNGNGGCVVHVSCRDR
jgi:hypothetical protein